MTPPGTTGEPDREPAADQAGHAAVVNDEGQYSIWPVWRPLPPGWHDTGVHGTRERCLSHIEAVWTDMRPRSLAARLDGN